VSSDVELVLTEQIHLLDLLVWSPHVLPLHKQHYTTFF